LSFHSRDTSRHDRRPIVNETKSRRTLVRVLGVAAVGALASGIAWATPQLGVTSTILNGGPTALGEVHLDSNAVDQDVKLKTKGESDVYVVHNRIVPGGHTGWHMHPGISVISVKSGTATEYHADAPNTPHVYNVGAAFAENTGEAHLIRNEGAVDLELVAFQIIPRGAPRRIDVPQP
jgi:quercetin dioxygenase-like cupin family protein